MTVTSAKNDHHHSFIKALLRPLARYCLTAGLRLQKIEQALREVLVEEAQRSISASSNSISVSKLSVATGIHRTEISRLLTGDDKPKKDHDVLNRVIGLWSQSSRFRSKDGKPRALSYHGSESEFARLVGLVSKEVTHYAVQFELERIGAISCKDDLIHLNTSEYVAVADIEYGLGLLSDDIETLASAVEHNLITNKPAHLHLKTSYDNIPIEALDEIRSKVLEKGVEFQADIRQLLAPFDRDLTPSDALKPGRAKVTVGSFSFASALQPPRVVVAKKRGRRKIEK